MVAFLSLFISIQLCLIPRARGFSPSRQNQIFSQRLPLLSHRRHCATVSRLYDSREKEKELTYEATEIGSTSPDTTSKADALAANKQDADTSPETPDNSNKIETADAVVCGGGPAGLLTAIMLAQQHVPSSGAKRFAKIRLYDRLSPPPNPDDEAAWSDVARFYLIGLGGRGRSALQQFGVWEAVEERCVAVVGRRDWTPESKEGTERIFAKGRKPTMVLPRDKLAGILHEHIVSNYADQIELNYGFEVQPVTFAYQDGSSALIRIYKCNDENLARMNPSAVKTAKEDAENDVLCETEPLKYISSKLLVAADGTIRTIGNAIEALDKERYRKMNPLKRLFAEKPFRVKRYVDDNQRIYKTIPMKIPDSWRPDLNYSARTKDGRLTFDALPANKNGNYCGVLLLKKGDPMARANTDPTELRRRLDEALPQFSALLDDGTIASVAAKPVSYLPGFRYAGPRLHEGKCCIILGDAAHTVKPYFGLGANSAMEDVEVFNDFLNANLDTSEALRQFSANRAPESKTLVRISRDLDRPGPFGFITFILPIILDSIFGKLAPSIFKPNIITMLQRESYTFQQVGRRKRFDRILQVGILSFGLAGLGMGANFLVQHFADAVGIRPVILWATLVATAVASSTLKRFFAARPS